MLPEGYMPEADMAPPSAATPGAEAVTVAELAELSARNDNQTRSLLERLAAPLRRTRAGYTVPAAWVRTHVCDIWA